MKVKAGFGFFKIHKIYKSSERLIKKKRERAKISKITNEKGKVTTDTTEIQRIIIDQYEQQYPNKMCNQIEMDKFSEWYNLPRLNQEETENY